MPDNPFANAFNPDRGGLTGFIGGLAGVPTQQEASGSVTGAALSQLSQLKESGLNNQQALLKFFQTPEGHDFFTTAGPEGLKSLADGLNATTQPAPTQNVLAPGAALASTDQFGNSKITAQNPQQFPNQVLGPQDMLFHGQDKIAENTNVKSGDIPSDVKSFTFFSQLAKLPQAEVQRLAALKADPTKGGPDSVASSAIDELVKNYGLSPQLGEAMKAGQVKVLPLKNEVGQDTGAVSIVDLTNPSGPTVQVLNPGGKGPAPTIQSGPNAPLPATSPDTGAATGTLPPASTTPTPAPSRASSIPTNNPKYFGDKASMFLAAGPIASGLQAASGVSEMVNPKLIIPEGAQAADRQTLIDTLRSDLAAMGQLGGGIGVNKGVLEGYLKLAPTGGLTESPHQAIQKAIRLSEHVQQEIDAQTEVYNNGKLPMEQRKGAQAIIQGWQRVQRDLPNPDQLIAMEKAIREGTAGAPTISGAVDTVVRAGSKAITEVKKEATKVQSDQGLGAVDIDSITEPKQLLAIDPTKLDRQGKIKYLRKVDQFKRGADNGGRP